MQVLTHINECLMDCLDGSIGKGAFDVEPDNPG